MQIFAIVVSLAIAAVGIALFVKAIRSIIATVKIGQPAVGRTDDKGRRHAARDGVHGQDIRPRGLECRLGAAQLPAGTLVMPAVLGLASAAGSDTVTAVPRPRVVAVAQLRVALASRAYFGAAV